MKGRKNQRGPGSPYSTHFRDLVSEDYLSGDLSYSQIAEKYGLSSREIPKWWVRCYRKKGDLVNHPLPEMTEKEKQEKRLLEQRIKDLEQQLSAERLHKLALETMIEVAEEELNVKIRKKSGTKRSSD